MSTWLMRTLGGLVIAALSVLFALVSATGSPAHAAGETDIRIVINQSPWLAGFANLVQAYEKDTGNKVALDVNPYAGSLEKQRNAVRARTSEYDILIINGILYAEMYHGGFLEPLKKIDSKFEVDPQIYPFDETLWYDSQRKTVSRATGDLMTIPVNPNITMLFYRKDLYAAKNLKVPETWEDLLANAKALNAPPRIFGITQRATRATIAVSWDYWPYLISSGGSLFRDEKKGDFFVTLNSPEAKKALDSYIRLAREAGPPNTASLDQTDLIQYISTGRSAHAVLPVAAQAQVEDPNKSIVVGQIGYAIQPHEPGFSSAPALGHWLAGIPKNVSDAKKRAALAFLDWFQQPRNQIRYAEVGGTPVSAAAYASDFANKPENSYLKALAEGLPLARQMWTIPEGADFLPILEVGLNRAVAGEISTAQALNSMAAEIEAIVKKAGYPTGRLPNLAE
jgi:multiple sugar transport system substrate-binding protein